MPVSPTALTTFDEVSQSLLRSDAEDKLASEVFDANGTWKDEGRRGIHDATDQVEEYLGRRLIVSKKVILTGKKDWTCPSMRLLDEDYPAMLKLHRVKDWPVLHVEEDVVTHGERRVYAKAPSNDNLNVIAGYRREDQELADFGSDIQSAFNDKSDIPTLPSDIVGVTMRLAVYYAKVQIKGLIGMSEERQNIGSNMRVTVEKTVRDEEYVANELRKLQSKRYIA